MNVTALTDSRVEDSETLLVVATSDDTAINITNGTIQVTILDANIGEMLKTHLNSAAS